MKLFCCHNWKTKVIAIIYPINGVLKSFKCSEEIFKEMLFGSKTITFSCEKCGKIINKKYFGEIED